MQSEFWPTVQQTITKVSKCVVLEYGYLEFWDGAVSSFKGNDESHLNISGSRKKEKLMRWITGNLDPLSKEASKVYENYLYQLLLETKNCDTTE